MLSPRALTSRKHGDSSNLQSRNFKSKGLPKFASSTNCSLNRNSLERPKQYLHRKYTLNKFSKGSKAKRQERNAPSSFDQGAKIASTAKLSEAMKAGVHSKAASMHTAADSLRSSVAESSG